MKHHPPAARRGGLLSLPLVRSLLYCCIFAATGCGGGGGSSTPPGIPPYSPAPTSSPSTPQTIAIEPMSAVDETTGTGYFSDPYPIRLAAQNATTSRHSFSGTTPALLTCPGPVTPNCFTQTPIVVNRGVLATQAQAKGSTISGFENNNIFQDDAGNWQMVTTLFVKNPAYPTMSPWTVIAHASPATQSPTAIPTTWTCDQVLVGSLATPGFADYDGKYVENAGQLYLLYSARVSNSPTYDGIVAQQMQSATQLAASPPVTMLAPAPGAGGYDSEDRLPGSPSFKLIETGNIEVIDGKYAMSYSVGAYDDTNYKVGIAWSDTLLPQGGAQYVRVLKLDTAGVWGQPEHEEVQYLLQSQISAWPNYVAAQVLAPGVASIAQDTTGTWYMYFAGFNPANAPIDPTTQLFMAQDRRPYFVKVNVSIPAGATVAGTPNAALATWVTPATQ